MTIKEHKFYIKAEMDSYFWGDTFTVERESATLQDIEFIDAFCVSKELKPLGKRWQKISFQEASKMLEDAFAFELAYRSTRIMPQEEAAHLKQMLISKFSESGTHCYTNVSKSPWLDKDFSYSSISNYTFDVALIFINEEEMTFTYFVGED